MKEKLMIFHNKLVDSKNMKSIDKNAEWKELVLDNASD